MKIYEVEVQGGAGGYVSVLRLGYNYATLKNKQRSQYEFEKLVFTTYVQISIEVPTKYIKRKINSYDKL